ncbi:uncharacterized protein Hap1MRO34_006150 isoform 2-T2 [Clarias gariepinus]
MSLSELQCCMTPWDNGSVSYTLSPAVPPDSTNTWTRQGMVIVSEDGDTDKNFVVCPTEHGYILRERFSEVVCKLEIPEKGVSMDVPCADLCNFAPYINPGGSSISQLHLGLIVGLSVFFLLFCLIVGILLYRKCQKNGHHDNSSDLELQSVPGQDQDEDHDQDFIQDQEDLHTEEHLTSG